MQIMILDEWNNEYLEDTVKTRLYILELEKALKVVLEDVSSLKKIEILSLR